MSQQEIYLKPDSYCHLYNREVGNENIFYSEALYIHLNPVNHGFVESLNEWEYSSYKAIVSGSGSKPERNAVIEWFDDLDNLIKTHENYNLSNLARIKIDD